jgi:glutamine amidotransferase
MPHMGWNDVAPTGANPLFAGLEEGARFYFLHSYYFDCSEADDRAATSTYGFAFACAVRRGSVHGVQFHPEKSHHWGEALLKNFAEA